MSVFCPNDRVERMGLAEWKTKVRKASDCVYVNTKCLPKSNDAVLPFM